MTSIFVAKLDFGITSEQLKQAFQEYGTVLKASIATDRETGKSRGFGFIEMADREEALAAIEGLDSSMMNGRPIAVKEAEQRQDSRPPRDPNSPRPDFNRNREGGSPSRPAGFQRPDTRTSDFKKPGDDEALPFTPPATPLKGEPRKAKVEKKGKDWDAEGKSKKPKMNAYKKSGKNNRFFGDDEDDDDLDIHSMDDQDDDEIKNFEDYYQEDDEDEIDD
jgi:RNA recognition motif-containing protein